jgi:hypothetical protein
MRALRSTNTKPARSRAGFSLVTIVGVWFSAQVQAQVSATADYHARMDADHDGRVTLVEYQDWLSYAFDAMDVDRDGTLAPGEQPGGHGQPITREAYRARLAAAFQRQDANRDGALSAAELAVPPR